MLGLLLGLQHSLEADHVAAVSSFLTRSQNVRQSSMLGMFWGVGHSLTLLVAGVLVLVTKTAVPANVSISFEFIVGLMLVFLGVWVVVRSWRDRVHVHVHQHDGNRHIHFHSHKQRGDHLHKHQTLVVGVVHGLAGTGVLSLLVLSTAATMLDGIAYIVLFGVGVTFGMAGLSTVIGIPLTVRSGRFGKVGALIRPTVGLLTIAIGFRLALETYSSLPLLGQ